MSKHKHFFYEMKAAFALSLHRSCIPTPLPTQHPTSLPTCYPTILPTSLHTPFNTVLNNRFMTQQLYTSNIFSTPCQVASECKGYKTVVKRTISSYAWDQLCHHACPTSVCNVLSHHSLVSSFTLENVSISLHSTIYTATSIVAPLSVQNNSNK